MAEKSNETTSTDVSEIQDVLENNLMNTDQR